MPSLTVRNQDLQVHQHLREFMARDGRPVDAEARAFLAAGLRDVAAPLDVFEVIAQYFGDPDVTGDSGTHRVFPCR